MAQAHFTDRFIRSLGTQKAQEEFYDTNFSGGSFSVRVTRGGRKTFNLAYRFEGRRRRVSLGVYPHVGLADARTKAQALLGDLARGKDPVRRKRQRRRAHTFKDLADYYLQRHARPNKKAKSLSEDQRILKTDLLPLWSAKRVADIKKRDVVDLLDSIKIERKAPVMANRVRALLSKLYNFCIEQDFLPEGVPNPCAGVKPPLRKEKSRERVLSEKEIAALWSELESRAEPTASIYRMILLTAQRPGEVMKIRWTEIDGEDIWTIPQTIVKNGREHKVPLSSEALKVLEKLQPVTGESEWVFASPKGGHIKWLQKMSKRLQDILKFKFRPHDLRRTAATKMAESGVDDILIAKILNHSWADRHVTRVYNRYSHLPEMQDALERLGLRLREIIERKANQEGNEPRRGREEESAAKQAKKAK